MYAEHRLLPAMCVTGPFPFVVHKTQCASALHTATFVIFFVAFDAAFRSVHFTLTVSSKVAEVPASNAL